MNNINIQNDMNGIKNRTIIDEFAQSKKIAGDHC